MNHSLYRLCGGILLLVLMMTGCANASKLGDRAFEAHNYEGALSHYERALEDGSRDPQVYLNAAISATKLGNFATAERYYSLSLRYGGGVPVARHLAQFYVQTSNYANAVRVFQYLLRYEEDPRPVYNNLGTALMYAGLPMDGETYLIIAQNLNPSSEAPYLNLGLLYDRYIPHPRLAIAFYQCFLELSNDVSQKRLVHTRIQEMQMRRPMSVVDVGVRCGEQYQPVHRGLDEIRRLIAQEKADVDEVSLEEVIEIDWTETSGQSTDDGQQNGIDDAEEQL